MIEILASLQCKERQALTEFTQWLSETFHNRVRLVRLYGSKARGEDTPASDIDILIVIDGDDWRIHKQISYFVVDLNMKYDITISPCVWSTTHFYRVAALGTRFYHNIQQEGVDLSRNSILSLVSTS